MPRFVEAGNALINAENKSHISEDICFYVTVDNHPWSYLFDCGMARYLGASDCKSLAAVFITHSHIDHFANFDTLLRHQLSIGRTVCICGPKGLARRVQARILSYTWNLIRRKSMSYEVRELDGDEVNIYHISPPKWELIVGERLRTPERICYKNNGIFVRYAELDHKIPSMAYLLEEESSVNIKDFPHRGGPWIKGLKEAFMDNNPDIPIEIAPGEIFKSGELFKFLYIKRGAKFGYAMDHLACPDNHEKLERLWRDADEVAIEGFFRECDRDYALKHYHSTVKESASVARRAGVKKLTLVHHSRRYAREMPDLLEEGYAAFEGREPRYSEAPVQRYADGEGFDA